MVAVAVVAALEAVVESVPIKINHVVNQHSAQRRKTLGVRMSYSYGNSRKIGYFNPLY